MRILLIPALCSLLAAQPSFAQGIIAFSTRALPHVDAPVMREDGVGIGSLWPDAQAQLYLVSGSGPSVTYTPLSPSTTFYTANTAASRYVVIPNQPVVVPGILWGQKATIQMRVWAGGSAYENATTFRAESNPFTMTLGGAPPLGQVWDPGYMVGLQSIIFPVPEPQTSVFLAISLLAICSSNLVKKKRIPRNARL